MVLTRPDIQPPNPYFYHKRNLNTLLYDRLLVYIDSAIQAFVLLVGAFFACKAVFVWIASGLQGRATCGEERLGSNILSREGAGILGDHVEFLSPLNSRRLAAVKQKSNQAC
jgi:hypothetical protein